MHLTTEWYLDALRQGDYLRALQWLEFLVSHYSIPDGDADTILQLAIFELIHHGFSSEDFHHIEMLYTLLYEQLPPFIERVGYNATVLCNAAMQYMIFEENDITKFYKTDVFLDARGVKKWMQRNNPQLEPIRNDEELMKKYTALNKSASGLLKQAQVIRDKINYILESQILLKNYLEELAKYQEKEGFSAVRFGVIKSLYSFLAAQTISSPEVMIIINTFIATVQKMEPYPWEQELLSRLIAKPEKPFISWFFDKSAEQFQFFAVKVIGNMLPSVAESPAEDSSSQKTNFT